MISPHRFHSDEIDGWLNPRPVLDDRLGSAMWILVLDDMSLDLSSLQAPLTHT